MCELDHTDDAEEEPGRQYVPTSPLRSRSADELEGPHDRQRSESCDHEHERPATSLCRDGQRCGRNREGREEPRHEAESGADDEDREANEPDDEQALPIGSEPMAAGHRTRHEDHQRETDGNRRERISGRYSERGPDALIKPCPKVEAARGGTGADCTTCGADGPRRTARPLHELFQRPIRQPHGGEADDRSDAQAQHSGRLSPGEQHETRRSRQHERVYERLGAHRCRHAEQPSGQQSASAGAAVVHLGHQCDDRPPDGSDAQRMLPQVEAVDDQWRRQSEDPECPCAIGPRPETLRERGRRQCGQHRPADGQQQRRPVAAGRQRGRGGKHHRQ